MAREKAYKAADRVRQATENLKLASEAAKDLEVALAVVDRAQERANKLGQGIDAN